MARIPRTPQSRRSARLRNGVFVMLITFPLILMLRGDSNEPFPRPHSIYDLFYLPADFKHYFSQGFRLRKPLARVQNQFMLKFNGRSAGGPVATGQNGWLFLAKAGVRDDYRNRPPLERETAEKWRIQIESNQRFCRERGIDYYFAVVPAKETVMLDELPTGIEVRRAGTSRAQHLQRFFLTKSIDLQPIDLVQPLQNSRPWAPPFYKTDTHWNEAGAFIGYLELLKRIALKYPTVKIPQADTVSLATHKITGGNEAQIMGLENVVDETFITLTLPDERIVHTSGGALPTFAQLNRASFDQGNLVTRCDSAEIPQAIVFHDSFGLAMMRFLARNFEKTQFVWSKFSEPAVDSIRPAIVIELIWAGHL